MHILIFLILGLLIGSFLNVLVYRIHVAEDLVFSRSHCPHCKKMIEWYDNIPLLSFILLKFRCRNCRKKISWQYPLVELSTGIIFAAIGAKYFIVQDISSWAATLFFLGAAGFLLAILVYDWLYMEIPEILIWPAVFWSLAFNLFLDWNRGAFSGEILDVRTYSGILAAFLAFTFFFLLSAFSKEKWMGMGDAYLAVFLGLVLGWPEILLALFLSFFIGSVCGIILIAFGKKKMKSQVPFAPFMVAGAFAAFFWFQPIVDWYFGLF
ncbi:MAG TPA: prepilin peptidase [Candidatus Moranbacteria bacterium]|nr:prepilin peptidase [Candidatus Moranbacteria bacterium]